MTINLVHLQSVYTRPYFNEPGNEARCSENSPREGAGEIQIYVWVGFLTKSERS